jgi:hypothetical protein
MAGPTVASVPDIATFMPCLARTGRAKKVVDMPVSTAIMLSSGRRSDISQ